MLILTLFKERLNLVKEPKSTIDAGRPGHTLHKKILTVIISTMFLHYFISLTSSDSVTTQREQTARIDVTHTEYNFVQEIKISA